MCSSYGISEYSKGSEGFGPLDDELRHEGAKMGVESRQEATASPSEVSLELPHKRQRTGEAILCMLGDMKTSFQDALKSTDPIPLPKATAP